MFVCVKFDCLIVCLLVFLLEWKRKRKCNIYIDYVCASLLLDLDTNENINQYMKLIFNKKSHATVGCSTKF